MKIPVLAGFIPGAFFIIALSAQVSCGSDMPPWLLDATGDDGHPVDVNTGRDTLIDDDTAGQPDHGTGRDDGVPGDFGPDAQGWDLIGEDASGRDVSGVDVSGADLAVSEVVVPDAIPDAQPDFVFCVPDCSTVECGPDPVCGQYCGSCDFGYMCRDGACHLWLPEDQDVNCKNGMCLVPAGPFLMGCNQAVDLDCDFDENPLHEVTLSAYRIDKYEVTVADFAKCVDAGVCTHLATCVHDEPSPDDAQCSWGVPGRELYPMHHVDCEDAKDYCAWAGKRLPSEAEWEKAARGTDGRKYPWGIAPASCEYAVMMAVEGAPGCDEGHTLPVGSKPAGASPYGVMDMAGNVWEWVHDWYRDDYYVISPEIDPQGPDSGVSRGLRGGAYNYGALNMRVSDRDRPNWYDTLNSNIGFRCAKDVPQD